MKKIILLIFSILILFTGCTETAENIGEYKTGSLKTVKAEEVQSYDIYYETSDYNLQKYEPSDGCYLGGYILYDKVINSDIIEFENLVEKEHSIYGYNMKIGDVFPLQWVLECYSQNKIPEINVYPRDIYGMYDIEYMEHVSKEFGLLNIPIFIQLLPNPKGYNSNEKEYINFYRETKKIFEINSPNTAFIWSTDIGQAQENEAFYPGDEYVDWVGLNIYSFIGEAIDESFWNDFEYFYYTYQKRKPIMISQLAVSHYSTENHSYEIKAAAEKINIIYSTIKNKFPRVKGIIYMDFDNSKLSPKSAVRNNFSICEDSTILNEYKKAVQPFYINNNPEKKLFLLKSPFKGYGTNEKVFIPQNTVVYDLNKEYTGDIVFISNTECIEIPENYVQVDNNSRSIIIKSDFLTEVEKPLTSEGVDTTPPLG